MDPAEIMHAEQELLREGTSIEELQRLCDVHSALFHGSTTEEKTANAEKTTAHFPDAQKLHSKDIKDQRLSAAAALIQISGHPLQTFTLENAALEKLIARARQALENNGITDELLDELRQIAIHYARKGDLLYPHLKVKYGISGPSAVMWTVDDEIRDELNALAKQKHQKETDAWKQRLNAVLTRMEEMIYKESNILFPNCALNFSEEEWYHIYRDAKDYAECFGIRGDSWEAAEAHLTDTASTADTPCSALTVGYLMFSLKYFIKSAVPSRNIGISSTTTNSTFSSTTSSGTSTGMGIITGASVGSEAAISPSISVELSSTMLSSSGLTATGGGGGGRGLS